ncbi:hypothetical protein MHI65_002364 [Clostridium botulinum]|uniref:hypothetical protein n=1 Tax=Clostridium botulinum TaxID=1491 RepID=UPI001C9B1FEC|nr:hypothetical protein [Clostridium botulinum]MBY6871622.1 hypothetical protein [Clostridium botulinum]WCJ72021.1 hypothetical protein MHB86_002364 [Clostridium botulinum]WCJ75860.1 hypothetical protein MHI66_002364 [Clostridium botulinum]WCJ79699.1 hypothetical protein MHI65_002364 [Clostridium botulinum]
MNKDFHNKKKAYKKALNDLKNMKKKAALAKTAEKKEIIENNIKFLKATIDRAKDLLNL